MIRAWKGTLRAHHGVWMSVSCQTGGGQVQIGAVSQSGLKHGLFASGLCCLADARMHLVVTDMCQTVSKLAAYLHCACCEVCVSWCRRVKCAVGGAANRHRPRSFGKEPGRMRLMRWGSTRDSQARHPETLLGT